MPSSPALKKIFFFVLLTAMVPSAGMAAEITVLRSATLPVYNEALQGFAEIIGKDPCQGQKAIQAHAITTHTLSEAASQIQLRQAIISEKPDLLVAIGSSSLALVKDIKDFPIVYLMVPFPESMGITAASITGIGMNIGVKQQLEALTLAAPTVRNIGILYDPQRSAGMVAEARDFASRNHLNLLAQPVRTVDEVSGQLASLKGRIDWLWMVPDLTVLTSQSIDFLFLFSLENRVPIFTFARKYLNMGAVLSVDIDPVDLGRQAGEMALAILKGKKAADPLPVKPRKVITESNDQAAEMLGVALRKVEGP